MKQKAPVTIDAPRFRSEAEEAEWWDSHQDLVAGLLLKHGRRAAMPCKSVTVRIPVTDIDKARQLAEAKGIGYRARPIQKTSSPESRASRSCEP